MTEEQALFLVLVLIYLSDGFIWVSERTVLFSSWWCRRFQASFNRVYVGIADGRVALLNPLPPLGSNFLAYRMPVSISPVGVHAFTFHSFQKMGRSLQTGSVLAYEEISNVTSDARHLCINGSRFVKCSTVEQAKSIAELINRVSCEPKEKREEVIMEFLAVQFSKDEAISRFTQVNKFAHRMRLFCSTYFIFIYVIAPTIMNAYGFIRFIIPVTIIIIFTTLFISVMYYRADKVLCSSKSSEHLSNIAKMILCPPFAIRAADLLTLNSMSKFHPLVLANLLLGEESKAFTRAVIGDLKHPIRQDLFDPCALSITSWYEARELEACMKFLEAENSKISEYLMEPPSWDGISSTYCPRCSCQFTTHMSQCPDCPGVDLLPYSMAQTPGDYK